MNRLAVVAALAVILVGILLVLSKQTPPPAVVLSTNPTFGYIVCTQLTGSSGIAVSGKAGPTFVDLAVQSVVIDSPPEIGYPFSYSVTVKNTGNTDIGVNGVAVQGYYSANTTFEGS